MEDELVPGFDDYLHEHSWDTNVLKLHDSTKTSQHATRDPTTQQQGWRSGLVSRWRLDHTRGSRQEIHSSRVPITMGRLWMARNHHNCQENHCALQQTTKGTKFSFPCLVRCGFSPLTHSQVHPYSSQSFPSEKTAGVSSSV